MSIEIPPGPPCDICGELPAVLSLLNYADYQQLKLCGNDAPQVMRGIADSMDGRTTAEPTAETEPEPELSSDSAADAPDSTSAAPGSDDDGQGSAKDHWASTTNVRRSTHGHRRPSSATGTPRKDEPQ